MKKLLLFFLLFTAARAAEDDITIYQRDATNRNQPVTINGTTQAGKALGFNSSTGVLEALTGTGTGSNVYSTSPAFATSVTTGSTTFALLNATATTINMFGAATTVNTGASAAQVWNFGGHTTASEFRFLEPSGSGTNYTGFKAAAQAANITYTWPNAAPTEGQALIAGATPTTLEWGTVAGGSGSVATDTIWNVAGDLVYGTGSDTASRLAIGTEGQTLAVSAGGTPEWLTTPLLGTAQTFTAQNTFSKAPAISRTDLAGGTSLTIGNYYYDALTTTRTLTFSGSPAAGNTISLKLVVTNAPVLTIPSCKRAGEANSAITSIQMTNGVHILTWTYVNAEWILNDTVGGPLDNAGYAEDAGANDTYVAALVPIPSAYVTGLAYRFKAATANTGAASINFNSLGAKTIVKAAGGITTALADNDIRAGQWVDLVYDGTNMQMVSLLGNAPAGSGDLLAANNLSDVASAATAADNLGLGTPDSPQLTAVNVGHATDTTLARVSAGVVSVEGVNVAMVAGNIGAATATTPSVSDNDTSVATTAFVQGERAIVTKNTAASYTIGTTDAREAYGGVIYVTGAATITAPAVAAGMSFTVITIGAVAVSVDVNAADLMYLNGTALADGDKATNASLTGDMIVFTYYDSTGWVAMSNSGWTDGN